MGKIVEMKKSKVVGAGKGTDLDREKLEQTLTLLMYRKEILERDIQVRLTGANEYSNWLNAAREEVHKLSGFEQVDLKKRIYSGVVTCREFISVYKELQREYEHHIIPLISETAEKLNIELNSDQVVDFVKKAKEMVAEEYLDAVKIEPANVELPHMIESYDEMIKCTEDLIKALENRLKEKSITALDKAEAQKQLVEEKMRLSVLVRRQKARREYYLDTFLPAYERDMKECKTLLPAYMSRGEEICRLGIDMKLCSMLQQYDGHKDDQEKLWLFYTALKKRVEEIREYVLKNPDRSKQFSHIANPITDELQPKSNAKGSTGRARSKK